MSETVVLDLTPDEAKEFEETFSRYIAEMEEMKEQIASNRRETERLRIETELMLKDTLTLLKMDQAVWQKMMDLARLVFTFGQETKKNSDEIKELQREVRQLTAAFQRLAYEHQRVLDEMDRMRATMGHAQQNEQHEREKIMLRIENEMLKFERRLPPSGDAT